MLLCCFWDHGHPTILQWQKKHKCRILCKKLGLKDADLEVFELVGLRKCGIKAMIKKILGSAIIVQNVTTYLEA